MVLPGIVARPSVCLRCQLREVLLQARIKRGRIPARATIPQQRCTPFSTRSRTFQEADEGILVKREKPYYWKKVKTPERVIGRPGRRQRVSSERLSTNSLDKPANVIVFRDVAEAPEAQALSSEVYTSNDGEPRPKALTAKEIEDAITGHYIAPAEAEVNLSIEGLRPQETVVNEREFQAHKRNLMKGYTYPQLSKYLAWSFRASGAGIPGRENPEIDGKVRELGWTTWRRGQTPLDQRHPTAVKKKGSNTKLKLVEQILRLAWHLTIQSEEQEIGELEVKLLPWQTIMLFDISQNDRPQYQSFIRSQILLDTTQVQSFPTDRVMRVTGRRQDAEEVARQLKLALLKAERLEIDFKPFRDEEQRFSVEELGYISDLTKTVIAVERDNVLAVYGISEAARHNARRLLLAMLDLPGALSFDSVSQVGTKEVGKAGRRMPLTKTLVPVDLSSGLHRRNRTRDLVRRMEPRRRKDTISSQSSHEPSSSSRAQSGESADPPPGAGLEQIAETVVDELAAVPHPPSKRLLPRELSEGYWLEEPSWTSWAVEFGKILHPPLAPPTPSSNKLTDARMPLSPSNKSTAAPTPPVDLRNPVLQHQVPGLQTLLSFFESKRASGLDGARDTNNDVRDVETSSKVPYLIAHFIPVAPVVATSYKSLPRIQARFNFSSPQPSKPPELLLDGIVATIDEQHHSVPLPEHAVDIRLSRRLSLKAQVDIARDDEDIRNFSGKLQESVHRRGGILDAPPELTFRLPRRFIDRKAPSRTVDVQYYFERFEQVQNTRFLPRQRILEKDVDEEVKTLVRSMPEDMLLDYGEVEGGAIYGSRTMLQLRQSVAKGDGSMSHADGHVESESLTEPSPTLDTDTARVSKLAEGDEEQSHDSTTHHGGDVQPVEQTAESSQDTSAKTKELVSTALKIASLLTRATSGSLKHYGSQK